MRIEDFGIRSVHLAYELMEGYDVLVLVDTVARQAGPPGSLYVIEPDLEALAVGPSTGIPQSPVDAHDLPPGGVLSLLPDLGGSVDRVLVVGCRPETLDDGIGLSPVVADAVERAAELVLDVVRREHARDSRPRPRPARERRNHAQEAHDARRCWRPPRTAVKMALPDLKRYLEMRKM